MIAVWFSSAVRRHELGLVRIALSARQNRGDTETASQITARDLARIAITVTNYAA